MPYHYLEDLTSGDVAFEATGPTVEELFLAAADATMNTMVADLDTIDKQDELTITVRDDEFDMLLFDFLGELVYYKDARQLLLRVEQVRIEQIQGQYHLTAGAWGEAANPARHELTVDVKAVTLHRLEVARTEQGWCCRVVLDV